MFAAAPQAASRRNNHKQDQWEGDQDEMEVICWDTF